MERCCNFLFRKEANHVFKYYGTGRYNCGYILGTLELFKRQELFTTLIWGLITKEQDKVLYEIPIKQESINPIVFVICKTSQLKAIRSNHIDVRTLTKICDANVPSGYTVLAENDETVEMLLTNNIIKLIGALGNSIENIYITDQHQLIEQYPITLTSSFIYPKDDKNMEYITIQAQLVIALSDLIYRLNLSQRSKAFAEKERANMNKEKLKEIKQQREDERLQKKVDLKKKEEEKIQGLSKEKKRKIEEKNYKKELKKKSQKFKMIKG